MSAITNPAELRRRGVEVLVRELGYANAMRFLLQYESGQGDYTHDRQQILRSWTSAELAKEADSLIRPSGPDR